MNSLDNYRQLVTKVDALCAGIGEKYREQIVCRKGCDACCRHLSLFWVEGVALALALQTLPHEEVESIRRRARQATPDGPCPLLENSRCLLYPARPIICRTHGLPLFGDRDGERFIDTCPENFKGLDSLPATAVIDLELLNTILTTINGLFVSEAFPDGAPAEDRVTIAESLLLEL
ncbi:MAG: iron-sulfur cluster-binding oxidoreductase [Desulfuromonadaceae bacterium GWC2_58_13]|nr:MAG: iron-sulfur cluster-binding oxidoreductase [Desulfuromonadaceae bacterium GWC2_58_13]